MTGSVTTRLGAYDWRVEMCEIGDQDPAATGVNRKLAT